MADAQRQGPQKTFKKQAGEENHAGNYTNNNSKFKYTNDVVKKTHEH